MIIRTEIFYSSASPRHSRGKEILLEALKKANVPFDKGLKKDIVHVVTEDPTIIFKKHEIVSNPSFRKIESLKIKERNLAGVKNEC